jgi:hypothetical protein
MRVWDSETEQLPGSWLVVQGDGNVVIYAPDGTPVWHTDTASDLKIPPPIFR